MEVGDTPMSQQDFMKSMNLSTLDTKTAYRWLKDLGFSFDVQKKVYFNDRHENPENIAARKEFIKRYFDCEIHSHRWVQITIEDAQLFESEVDANGNKLMTGSWACEFQHENGTLMREYHIDCHPAFFDKYVLSEENKLFGGNPSVCCPVGACPKILIGQDECIIKENIFSSKQWNGSEGQNTIRPKDDGHAWMLSAFISRAWSFNVEQLLTKEKLSEINMHRQQQHYISIKSVIETKGTSLKSDIVDCSPFCHFFDYGANKEGYWNFHHAALQLEDLVDCLVVLFPDVDFVFLFDQSISHGRRQKDGLSVHHMNWKCHQSLFL